MLDAATAADARFTFKVGAVATHLLALVIVIDSVRQFKTFLAPTAPLLTFATFALHPTLMVIAFSFCAPIGAVSWRVQHDFMGVSHVAVKRFHLVINTAAVLIGWLGILDMWLVHANHADAQRAKGWAVHFQSSHSWPVDAAGSVAMHLHGKGSSAGHLGGHNEGWFVALTQD